MTVATTLTGSQLALRLEVPAHGLVVRARIDQGTQHASRDWARDGSGFRAANGWTVARGRVSGHHRDVVDRERGMPVGWIASGPEGHAEWWATDPFTCMERAEGIGA